MTIQYYHATHPTCSNVSAKASVSENHRNVTVGMTAKTGQMSRTAVRAW